MSLSKNFLDIKDSEAFKKLALELFAFQFETNAVYRSFCDLLFKHPSSIDRVEDIPFLPISFFKSKKVIGSDPKVDKVFSSSGTTGTQTSKHYVSDLSVYKDSFLGGFQYFYGKPSDYVILGLLPNYLERDGSSLIYMVDSLIQESTQPESGFYLYDHQALDAVLNSLERRQVKTLLIGVSFALLDFIEQYPQSLRHTIVMETGGMKGRRKELVRQELHSRLKKGFGVNEIHSEYGMTELLSQAYSKKDGIFYAPPWMKVFSRETEDPLSIQGRNKTGGLNIIDLANRNSCSFIATQDLGRVYEDGSFEVIGRFDHSDIRGCNLMAL